MIDTLTISKQLQDAGVAQKEADAIAIQMANFAKSELASKQNLKETELALQKEIEGLRLEIRQVESGILKWVAGFLVGQTALLFTLIKFLG